MARQSLSPMKGLDDYGTKKISLSDEQLGRKRRDMSLTHLKYLRKKNGYTLESLSQVTNISISYLSRLESGARRLNTDLIRRLSHAFKCEPAELLQEIPHEGRFVSPLEFSRKRRAELINRESTIPLYYLTRSDEDVSKLIIKITPPSEWKIRPSELIGRDRAFALRAEGYFLPHFSNSSTLFLESATALIPESTVVMLSSGTVIIKKVWSLTPTSLQLCDMVDIEKMKRGERINSLVDIQRESIDFIYKVVGYSDFDVQ